MSDVPVNINSSPSEIEERKFNLKLFLFQYLRYWYLFIITIILSVIVARYYNWYTTPMYRASCKIIVKDENYSSGTENLLKELNLPKSARNIENEIEVLKSRSTISKAIEELEFDVSYILQGKIKTTEMYKQSAIELKYDSLDFLAYFVPLEIEILDATAFKLTYTIKPKEKDYVSFHYFGDKINNPLGTFSIIKRENVFDNALFDNPTYDKRIYRITFNTIESLVDVYSSSLDIDAPKGSSILQLSAENPVPEKATDFLDKLADMYIKNGIEQKNELASNSLKFINEQLKIVSNDLEGEESYLEKFKTKRGITDISTEASSFLEEVKKYDSQISELDVKLSFLAYLEKYVSDERDHTEAAPSSLGIADPLLQKLITQLNELESERKKLSDFTKADNPLVISLNSQILNTRANLLENIKSIKEGILASKAGILAKLDDVENSIKDIPKTERELIKIKRQLTSKESLYLFLLEKQSETSILLASAVSDNRIIDKARASYTPFKPVKSKSYAIAILLGILLPASFIYFKNVLNDKIADTGVLQEITKIPILGIVGYNDSKSNVIVAEDSKSLLAESFRSVRTNLQFFGANKKQHVILVTSSIGNEGKTFCAINLACIFAISGKKTALLGFDLRKPKIANDFGLKNDTGISNYLIGAADEKAIIQSSPVIPNLDILLSGPIPPNPSELIMSEKTNQLFEYLRNNYDCIIIDTPPIGLVTDGLLLLKYSDTNIYVVRQNITSNQHIEFVNQLYKESKIPNLSILFNAYKANKGRYGYYYDYGYGYGYGYGYYAENKEEDSKKLVNRIKAFFSKKAA